MPPTTARFLVPLLIATFAGCVDDTGELPDELPDDIGTSAACVVPPTPPPYDQLWIMEPPPNEYRSARFSNYGTTECSAFTLAVRNSNDLGVAFTQDSTQAECEETSVLYRRYAKRNGTWSLHESGTKRGHWIADPGYCYQYGGGTSYVGPNEEMRMRASARRTTCAGQLCATTYGLTIALWTDAD